MPTCMIYLSKKRGVEVNVYDNAGRLILRKYFNEVNSVEVFGRCCRVYSLDFSDGVVIMSDVQQGSFEVKGREVVIR